jgi:hypothetical protein
VTSLVIEESHSTGIEFKKPREHKQHRCGLGATLEPRYPARISVFLQESCIARSELVGTVIAGNILSLLHSIPGALI